MDFNHRDNYVRLIRETCDAYGLIPNETNGANIHAFLQRLNPVAIIAEFGTLEKANEHVVKLYGKMLKLERPSLVDDLNKVKEFQLKLIKTPGDDVGNAKGAYKNSFVNREGYEDKTGGSIGSLLAMPPPDQIEVIRRLNYSSLKRDEYILIDSRYQNIVNPDRTKMVFSLITSTKIRSDHGGVIVGTPIKNIVELEIYPFTIPYKPIYSTFYKKITLSINEWTSSSFEAYEGGQFHFCFDIDKIDENLIYLKPINSIYAFSSPVNYVDNFTISFGAVFPKITFDPDRMYPSKIDFTNEYGLFEFSTQHMLVTGDLVYISGFDTPDPAKDVLIITEINRAEGHTIVKKDNFSFIVNVDLSTLRIEDPVGSQRYPIEEFKQDVVVFFASKRVQIQLRMRYLTSDP